MNRRQFIQAVAAFASASELICADENEKGIRITGRDEPALARFDKMNFSQNSRSRLRPQAVTQLNRPFGPIAVCQVFRFLTRIQMSGMWAGPRLIVIASKPMKRRHSTLQVKALPLVTRRRSTPRTQRRQDSRVLKATGQNLTFLSIVLSCTSR